MSVSPSTLPELLSAWSEADRAYQRAESLIGRWESERSQEAPAQLYEVERTAWNIREDIADRLRLA